MFLYTVSPISPISRTPRKQPARRVQPVSRVKAAGLVERGQTSRHDIVTPPQQAYELQEATHHQGRATDQVNEIGGGSIAGKQEGRERPIGELDIQNMLPLLLMWRHPKTVISGDYIEKHQDRLHAAWDRHNRGGRSGHWHVYPDNNGSAS